MYSYLHKGYWYYGSYREENELKRFGEFINERDCVFEVGGHIGYVTQIFEKFVGENGSVIVAEPTEVNRKLLERNVRKSTLILPLAVSDTVGEIDFFTEEFGGFTNSLVSDFTISHNKSLGESQKNKSTKVTKITVSVSTVDEICKKNLLKPNFMKIDVEGAEISVLKGAKSTLNHLNALMVEVSRNHEEVYDLLSNHGFKAMDSYGNHLVDERKGGNIFFYR